VLKAAHDAEEFYEDRGARISILAGRKPPRPDTLKQTDQPPISTNPLQTGRAVRFQRNSGHIDPAGAAAALDRAPAAK
jgi:hypothetical protein